MGNQVSNSETTPVKSTLDKKSTAFDAAFNIDLKDKVAIVTGCNTGIGREIALTLAEHNCTVIMACRNRKRASVARKSIIDEIVKRQCEELESKECESNSDGGSKRWNNCDLDSLSLRLQFVELDLSSFQSIEKFVGDFRTRKLGLDYLINNAGVYGYPQYSLSSDGFELQFQINFLGRFYLTNLLLPYLLNNDSGVTRRIVNVASAVHKKSPQPFGQWLDEHITNKSGPTKEEYGFNLNYAISKACDILWSRALHYKYEKSGVLCMPVHPGFVATDIGRNVVGGSFFMGYVAPLFIKNAKQGAASIVRCVSQSDDEVSSGSYYVDCVPNNALLSEDLQARDVGSKDFKESDTYEFKCWKLAELLLTNAGVKLLDNDTTKDVLQSTVHSNEEVKEDA